MHDPSTKKSSQFTHNFHAIQLTNVPQNILHFFTLAEINSIDRRKCSNVEANLTTAKREPIMGADTIPVCMVGIRGN